MKFQPVRGTKDYFAQEVAKFQQIIVTAKNVGKLYNFKPLYTPVFEFTEVFARTLGDESDVVNKEMYSFDTRSGESITLRPEFTAGIVRSFISNGFQQNLPCKFFSYGPVFRYERPQKGRQRQFHQFNFEQFGVAEPYADAEMIILASRILDQLGVPEGVEINLNTLGDVESRKQYLEVFTGYLGKYENELSEDSQVRLKKNPLRILDSKDQKDKEILQEAPKISDYLNKTSVEFFEKVCLLLEGKINHKVKINSHIVRGLDYYNHTVFEFIENSGKLGAQNTLLAGGRYDGLVKQMGGAETPAVGFAGGIERIMLLDLLKQEQKPIVSIISDDNQKAFEVAEQLRSQNLVCEVIYSGNFRKKIAKADKAGASYILFVFDDGFELKNLKTGHQQKLSISEVASIAI